MGIAFAVIALLAIIFTAIYIFLIMPRVADRADMDLLISDYAHRGLYNNIYPENSLPAFALAVKEGYGIEFDLQLSKDGEIMVFHDYNLKRMCGIDKKLSDLTYDELSKLTLANSSYRIPKLSDVLKIVDGKVPLLIEFKGENENTELCKKSVNLLDKYDGAFCVESFNPLLMRWFKLYRPRYARGQLVTKIKDKKTFIGKVGAFVLTNMLLNFLSRPDFVAVDGRIRNKAMIKICSRLFKARIYVWTVRNQNDYNLCRKDGYNSIFEKFIPS